ncbi:hypothetical protein JX265_007146 [Neoarthrinium moseri]|uniref:S-adenosyl-L-methionine-dependent methyltransferase n=1 Tax=Neoarthrinium moseri TaxID=1658444 RepID=A0A9P9WKQ8_9PEZI|nr:hypothetical protein JX265_007146 [Neoarthrinium moseri]
MAQHSKVPQGEASHGLHDRQAGVSPAELPAYEYSANHGLLTPATVLPSQLLESYRQMPPPARIYSESPPIASRILADSVGTGNPQSYPIPLLQQPSFAEAANEMINQALGRTPGGTSVVEPDSVLGESGRLYHGYKDGSYLLPNDAAEQERLDLQHEMFRILFDGWLALAPLTTTPRFVLDIGTGTGIFILLLSFFPNVADSTDSSQFTYKLNKTLSHDGEAPWYFPDPMPDHTACHGPCQHWISFDYIHLRLMFTAWNDARMVMQTIMNNLSPGGWVEFQESNFDYHQSNDDYEGNALIRWTDAINKGAAARGRDITVVPKYKDWLEELGFVNISVRRFALPMNSWPENRKLKKVGSYNMANVCEIAHGTWKLLEASGMKPDEIESLISEVRTEVRHRRNHTWCWIWVICAQKPLTQA